MPEALPESVGVKALAAKEMVMSGITHERPDLLVKALRMMYMLPPSKDMIAQSGLGFLLADETVWAMVEDRGIREKAQRLQNMWKKAVKEQHAPPVGSEEDNPLKGKKAKEVVELIKEWRDWAVVQMSVTAEETPHLRDALAILVLRGFSHLCRSGMCAAPRNGHLVKKVHCEGDATTSAGGSTPKTPLGNLRRKVVQRKTEQSTQ